ncbi:Asp23/Gls24 family envelope stress response protein [Meiothermus granaticius]|uniref:Asp23 family, cell envelope-related function n=1 Tax=Meiothermus granaticius NBRC 107808 TaxID=1227551 RepID=A0A399FEB8_9DEIN|nr:Asp23/Gls24 family envelope stress response protein [Meiothermus granaticius]MCL6526302.1 Asp23/Gls24 family envelope stress response protein [Thermaceae bacterium]RIH93422.1 Asp23 family, cell envelope-related function [Meiothermus granaticius NBRC 107808]GEM87671.1 alkaline-shock protein [Meiothermus granaticius NBRC 107808]
MVDYDLSENALVSLVTLALEGQTGVRLAQPSSRSVGEVLSGRRTRPVRLEREGDHLSLDLSVCVDYGKGVQEVCKEVQKGVAEALSAMTGLKVKAVNITVVAVEYKEPNAA